MPADNLPAPVTEARLGPAMLALPNDMMREFVAHLVEIGCAPSQAAAAAGYSGKSAAGARLVHDPRVQAAIHEECLRRVSAHGPVAFKVLIDIATNSKAKNADRIKATTEILNRGGFHAISEHKLTVTHQTEADKDHEILALAAELGLDDAATAKLLGKPVVREIEVEIIPAEPRPVGRPITNPDRTPDERAANLVGKYRSPEERTSRNTEFAEEQRKRGREIYARAQEAREAKRLGFDSFDEMHMALHSEGLEDVLGLDEFLSTPTEGVTDNE